MPLSDEDIFQIVRAGFGDTDLDVFVNRFRDGDFIYGIGPSIAEYWTALELKASTRAVVAEMLRLDDPAALLNAVLHYPAYAARVFQDRVRHHRDTDGRDIGARSNVFIQFRGADNMQVTTRGRPNMRLASRGVPRRRQEFYNRFNDSGYAMRYIDNAAMARGIEKDWQGHGAGAALSLGARGEVGGGDLASLRQYMVRRACKFLLYDVVNNGGRIHYALDGIDLEDVVGARHRALDAHRSKVPVCTSELREIFRMWSYLGQYVQFYRGLRPVPPPWQTASGEMRRGWAQYALHRFEKALNGMEGGTWYGPMAWNRDSVKLAFDGGRYGEVIEQYHGIPWSMLPRKGLPFDLPYRL